MVAAITGPPTATPNSVSTWTLFLADLSPENPWSFSTSQQYAGPLATAEWIEEATTQCGWQNIGGCNVSTLADFNLVQFDSFITPEEIRVSSAAPTNPQLASPEAIAMNNPPNQVATPSPPDCDSDGFAVAIGSYAPYPPDPLILTTALPETAVGSFYSQTLNTLNSSPMVWSGSCGPPNAPPGLCFANGTVSGIPTTPGTFAITASGFQSANPLTSCTQTIPITVLSAWPGPPDFTLSGPVDIGLSGEGSVIAREGGGWLNCKGTAYISITPTNGFTGSVKLSSSAGSFAGSSSVSYAGSFVPNPVSLGGSTASVTTLTVTFSKCSSAGTPTLTIAATAPSISHKLTIPVNVPPPPAGP